MLKTSWIILIGFIFFLAIDLISTLRVGDFLEYLEANPIYLYFGWGGFAFMNLLAIYILLRGYCHKQMFTRFLTLTAFVYLCVLRIFASINNWKIGDQVISGELTKEVAMSITDTQKTTQYGWLIMVGMFIPLVMNMVIYWLMCLDHKLVERNENKFYK